MERPTIGADPHLLQHVACLHGVVEGAQVVGVVGDSVALQRGVHRQRRASAGQRRGIVRGARGVESICRIALATLDVAAQPPGARLGRRQHARSRRPGGCLRCRPTTVVRSVARGTSKTLAAVQPARRARRNCRAGCFGGAVAGCVLAAVDAVNKVSGTRVSGYSDTASHRPFQTSTLVAIDSVTKLHRRHPRLRCRSGRGRVDLFRSLGRLQGAIFDRRRSTADSAADIRLRLLER